MAFIRWIIGFLITIGIATFAAINRQDVDININPIDDELIITLPVYGIMIGSLVVGFIFGGSIVWLNGSKTRRERRKANKDVKSLEKTVSELQDNRFALPPIHDVKETKTAALTSKL